MRHPGSRSKEHQIKQGKEQRPMNKNDLLHQAIDELAHLEKRAKANDLIVQRLRNFFDGPNFVQADLTRDAFYKILHDSKLEANGHQEQKP